MTIAAKMMAIPTRLNMRIVATVLAINACLFAGVPLLAHLGPACLALIALPLALATVPHWALIHEAVHGHLHHDRTANDRLGRLLAICFGAPFDALKFGHLSHHALNARAAERPEFYDPQRISRWRAILIYYVRLLFGLFFVEVASGPLSLLPRRVLRPLVRHMFYDGAADAQGMADRADRQLLAPERLHRIRRDALAIIALFGAAFWLYGVFWPVLCLALIGRAFIVSFMDNAPHYHGPLASPDQGYDMRAPAPIQLAVLNSNLHGVHHANPNLPWTALPEAFSAEGRTFHGSYLTTPWRQLRGPAPLGSEATG